MGTITSAICDSFKAEVLEGAHCFNATASPTGTTTAGSAAVTAVSSLAGIAVGMAVANANIPAGAVVASIISGSAFTLSQNATGAAAGTALTISGDPFRIALIKYGPTGSYGAANVNYSDLGADEVSGTGYTAGGLALTNVTPGVTSNTGWTTFNNSPATTWTSATIDAGGAMIYNGGARLGGTSGTNTGGANRACAVFAFPGEEKVTAGTLTITYPQSANGLLSIT